VIGTQKYLLRGDQNEEHLREVAEMIRSKVDLHRKTSPSMNLQKCAVLTAFDLASELLEYRQKVAAQRDEIVSRAERLLARIESRSQ
jgi:cell division protein ZapA (FtsZ GTPase activity inhibitor)